MQIDRHPFRSGHLVRVMAFAGNGKTTTLVECVKFNKHLNFLYTSFSKAVIEEAHHSFRLNHNVKISTFHSLAYRAMNMGVHRQKIQRGDLKLAEIRKKLNLPTPLERAQSGEEVFPIALAVRNALLSFMASRDTDN